jgi:hypothetical protein
MLWARIAYSVKNLYRLDGLGIESDPEAHPSSPTMGDGFVSRGENWPWHGVNHPHLFSSEVEERVELYLSSPLWAFMAWFAIGMFEFG